jgi:ABC-2 type transport system ATP-binding protein
MAQVLELASPEFAAARHSSDVALRAEGVTKRWSRRQQPILNGIDFALPRGAFVGLQGSNGAGKTTLLRILAGLFLPDSGTVSLEGLQPVRHRREYQRRLGFLAAGQGGLYARMTVKSHLEYWARLALLPARERRVAVALTLGRFDLLRIAGNRVDRLSTGQRQRVRLAMAFLHEPNVILLDEPSNSLDEAGLTRLHSVLEECKRAEKSVVWCAPTVHGLDVQFDDVYELVDGKLIRG